MVTDESLCPGPLRVICADGQFTEHATEEIIAKYSVPRDCVVQPKFQFSALGMGHPSKRLAQERADRKDYKARFFTGNGNGYRPDGLAVAGPSKTRTRPRRDRPKGRGQDWNRINALTIESILDLQKQGMVADQIAERFGCKRATIYKRLRLHRKSSVEASHQDDALRTCKCGNRKWPSKPTCCYCAREI